MADTGCQDCLVGVKVIHGFGLSQRDLILVTIKLHAANNKGIRILGTTILRLIGKDNNGNLIETKQMTYVTDSSEKHFVPEQLV